MKLPKITAKQQEIIELLYRYRFLNRIQIQVLMNHKDRRRVISWLKDLREKNYIDWIYSTDFTEKCKPAIYYISLNGVRYLKTVLCEDDMPYYPLEEVRKRYRENKRSKTFIDRSILVADCCLALEIPKIGYTCITEADYIDPDNVYHFLMDHETLRPDLLIIKRKGATTYYLLTMVDDTLPHYRFRYRLKTYVEYLDDREWENELDSDKPPVILLVCPSLISLIYAKRRTKKLLLDIYDDEIDEDIHIRFTTAEQLREQGIKANIWEEGRKLYSV